MKISIVKIILLILSVSTLQTCTVLSVFFRPSGFIYKYDGKYTSLDTLIDIDGYYKSNEPILQLYPSHKTQIPLYSCIMFYRDGLVCCSSTGTPYESFKDGLYPVGWGTYIIMGDTIKCQFIPKESVENGAPITNRNFLIVSISELKEICPVHLNDDNYSFHPLENRIDSTNWLLKKKWFWEKDAYEKYKEKLKQE
ncbi:hypothetical protein D0T53_10295 [Dysgonomonas sp. 216]|uniref:hypothetical protein n=1 Tax=Dysgonomonas sp. 216 TaxID=2302934 RepID=UPI0013D0545D|nr:hypothetical protein [Dysgonomonas sp. 216]NDW19301.1 hypothetical protein [Dysgonomonas sp. 216]